MNLDTQFFVSLAGIVVADLVLAGDNAVVIALAARNLPKELRRKAVFFGAICAIGLRAALTVAAVFLLRGDIPFVMLIGGVALLWIGWQLAVQQEHDHEAVAPATSMRGAIRTILIADVVMSIDNVLAVAAFAKDDPWLAVIGLIISIPIIMGGATLLLRLIDRFPIIVWIGAALIIYVGMELIMQDVWLHERLPEWLQESTAEKFLGLVGGVLVTFAAWIAHSRAKSKAGATATASGGATGDPKIELPVETEDQDTRLMVDGSRSDEESGHS